MKLKIRDEDYRAWCRNPVTQLVLKAVNKELSVVTRNRDYVCRISPDPEVRQKHQAVVELTNLRKLLNGELQSEATDDDT